MSVLFQFPNNYSLCAACKVASVVSDSATLWTVARQAPLSMGILSRQEYWSGLPCPSPGDILDPGIKPATLTSPALAGIFFFLPLEPPYPIEFSQQLYEIGRARHMHFTHGNVSFHVTLSIRLPLPSPSHACKSILCVCFSIVAL